MFAILGELSVAATAAVLGGIVLSGATISATGESGTTMSTTFERRAGAPATTIDYSSEKKVFEKEKKEKE